MRRAGAPGPVAAAGVADPMGGARVLYRKRAAAPAYGDDLVYYKTHRVRPFAARSRVDYGPEAIVNRAAANGAGGPGGLDPCADLIARGAVGAAGVLLARRGDRPPKTKTGRPRRAPRVSCDPICKTKTARPATVCRAVSRPVCGLQGPVCGAGAAPSGACSSRASAPVCGRLVAPAGAGDYPRLKTKTGAPWPPSSLCIESRISVYFGRGPAPPFNPPVPVGAQSTT